MSAGPARPGPSTDAAAPNAVRGGQQFVRGPAGVRRHGRRGATRTLLEPVEPQSYYGRPILKETVWSADIPAYLFVGGLAGASASLAAASELRGNSELARRAWWVALGGLSVSPVLLIRDLGRPARFLYMLRVFKVTSPMSVGTWILSAISAAVSLATARATFGWFPRLGAAGAGAAGLLGPLLATYTAVLIADTAVPVWHEAYRELPFVFAGSAAASAGAAAAALTPSAHAVPAHRLAVAGALLEMAAVEYMEHQLGDLGEPYKRGTPKRMARAAKNLTLSGAAILAVGGRRGRWVAGVGAGLVLAGAAAQRFAIFEAGKLSALDPKYTVGPQRRRVATSAGARS